ncbi:MAG TPA: NAD(P)/FAD-dependent oxidoreductase [Acidimicrobiales bacterium]|nr:NAD(P)/FAD-dependent oxidoreductase [Acidimicrobiales bacterium]
MAHDVVVIGAGFGGLAAAVALRRAGVSDCVVLERAEEIGGTWRDNTYPGCRCDVGSNLYSLSFAPNPDWSNTYSYQPEIQRYLLAVTERFHLRPLVRLGHEVTAVSFERTSGQWRVTGPWGERRARCVVLATGSLAEARLPDLPGVGTFAGRSVHTARWDDNVDLFAKRVAVVGTGASAIQVVPEIAAVAAELTVFQRTPPWILPHGGRAVPERIRALYRLLPPAQRLARLGHYLQRELLVLGFVQDPARLARGEAMARAHLEAQVADVALRERLTPDYRLGCKRVLLSNDYYPALTRPNVHLVTEAIERVEPTGLRTVDGAFTEVDAVVWATGFRVTDNPVVARVTDADGRSLADALVGRLDHYRGTTFPGYPNLFMLGGPNTGLGHSSVVFMMESQLRYVTAAVRRALAENALIEPTSQAAADWTGRLRERLPHTVWGSGCASWYLAEGGVNTTIWPDFTFAFRRATRRFEPRDHRVAAAPATTF